MWSRILQAWRSFKYLAILSHFFSYLLLCVKCSDTRQKFFNYTFFAAEYFANSCPGQQNMCVHFFRTLFYREIYVKSKKWNQRSNSNDFLTFIYLSSKTIRWDISKPKCFVAKRERKLASTICINKYNIDSFTSDAVYLSVREPADLAPEGKRELHKRIS